MGSEAKSSADCPRKENDSCPSGHELARCRGAEGYQCKQCSALTFQPNENWLGDRCRLRRGCDKPSMTYEDHGSTTRDAHCACVKSYHFENEDQRACVPNRPCPKGYGQGQYGVCIRCIDQSMYSDTNDRIHKCKPLTNCEKQSRCTITKSNGTFDNVCGPKVRDVMSCDDPQPAAQEEPRDSRVFIIAGGLAGSVILVFLILLIFFIIRRNSLRRRKYASKPLSQEQLEEIKLKLIKECERDGALCKRVLSKSGFLVEERIDRQIWTLAQELYRKHPIQGKYELIVEKYKESQPKYAVNGYLTEWKSWRAENKEAVLELFYCLAHTKRDDIVYEICNSLRHEVDCEAALQEDERAYNACKHNFLQDLRMVFCPCLCRGPPPRSAPAAPAPLKTVCPLDKARDPEANSKLLEVQSQPPPDVVEGHNMAGAVYRARPSPSAPAMDGDDVLFEGQHGVHRQYSQPVQATT